MRAETADYIRFLIFLLYGLTIGHIAWIIKLYAKYTKHLLPRHIAVVGVMYIAAITEVVWQNAIKVGHPFSWYVPINFIIMAGSLFAMRDMRRYLSHVKARASAGH